MTRRIALISEHASPLAGLGGVDSGGQNVYVGQVARQLVGLGYRVDVFTRRDSESLPTCLKWQDGVRIIHVPAGPAQPIRKEDLLPYMAEFSSFMADFCRRQDQPYDLIHANFWMSGLVAAGLKQELGLPFVITFHALGRIRRQYQGRADDFPAVRFQIEEQIVAQADHVIAECPQDKEDLIKLYGADPSRITIIPCGFDPTLFEPMDKAQARIGLGLKPDERVVLQLGRMVARKGVDNAIEGFARLVTEHGLVARLLVVGGESVQPDPRLTPEIGRLQALAQALGVADRVQFVGQVPREELKQYYNAADIFVTTPWYEPFGITPLEAMACGRPVIGSNVGGIKFTVQDGKTGFLVPPNDPVALGQRLADLYRNPVQLKSFGQQALQRANDLFTWQIVTRSLTALYERVLQPPALPVPSAAFVPPTSPVPPVVTPSEMFDRGFEGVIRVLQESRLGLRQPALRAAQTISDCFSHGNKLLLCGNGGSAADAQHFASELVGRFKDPHRAGLPALALTADSAFLTAWANDVGYEGVFSRQIETFGQPGDILLGISTSGRSHNLVEAFKTARRLGLTTVGLLGKDGGDLAALSDIALIIPSWDTQHIQEAQIVVIHLLCELVEEQFLASRHRPDFNSYPALPALSVELSPAVPT